MDTVAGIIANQQRMLTSSHCRCGINIGTMLVVDPCQQSAHWRSNNGHLVEDTEDNYTLLGEVLLGLYFESLARVSSYPVDQPPLSDNPTLRPLAFTPYRIRVGRLYSGSGTHQ